MDLGAENQRFQNKENNLEGRWQFFENINDIFDETDAVVVLTEWDEYKNIDWGKVSQKMRKPSWIFDARSILNKNDIKNSDLNFWRIGDGLEK